MNGDRPGGDQPGWYPDPTGVHELRYHNGVTWTGDVSSDGRRSVAPFVPTEPRLGTLALTAGVVGLAIAWLPFVFVFGIGLGVVAIVAGWRGRRFPSIAAPSTAGLVTGVIALGLGAVGAWLTFAFLELGEPGAHEVELDFCAETDGVTRASGTVTNLSGEQRSYRIDVELVDGHTVEAEVDDVHAGDTAEFTVDEDLRFDELDCRIVAVRAPLPITFDIED